MFFIPSKYVDTKLSVEEVEELLPSSLIDQVYNGIKDMCGKNISTSYAELGAYHVLEATYQNYNGHWQVKYFTII